MTRPISTAASLAAVALAVLALPGAALGKTLEVSSTAEEGPGSLGETILEAGPGDVIELPPGEYLLTNGDTLIEQGNVLEDIEPGTVTIVPSGGGEALADPAVTVSETIEVAEPRNPEGEESADGDEDASIEAQAQVIALIATVALFLLILELVRRRRLVERYALLWMGVAIVLLVLAVWTDGLEVIADAIGIAEPANAIFILAFGAVFVLLLHFSVATSRLGEETKILAQEVARLDQEAREARRPAGETTAGGGSAGAAAAEHGEDQPPVRGER